MTVKKYLNVAIGLALILRIVHYFLCQRILLWNK